MAYDEISKPISVSEANRLIKDTLYESFYQIMIVGEVSGFRPASTGHWYFDLKDKDASLPSAVFKNSQYGMPKIQNGDLVVAIGRIDLWEKTGKISFIIQRLVKKGDGDLLALIEKRKQYYQSLGWFDIDKKKPIPKEITKLGVVTSPTGAAIQDILNITKRRAPSLDIIIFPCAVQGDGAAVTIASRIRQANNFAACDVLIVGRGGGSQEDLACFSEDEVIEAIFESDIPIISAVGHEIDFPLSDFVADHRAPTPSAAAELVTETIFRREERLNMLTREISHLMRNRISEADKKVLDTDALRDIIDKKFIKASSMIPDISSLEEKIMRKLDSASYRLDMAIEAAENSLVSAWESNRRRVEDAARDQKALIDDRIRAASSLLDSLKKETEALSPLSVLKRGYAVVTDKNGKALTSAKSLKAGDEVRTRLYKGEFTSIVKE